MIRFIWIGLGCFCVGLGFLGAVVPLLPTVPMMLLAAFCFTRSSPRLLVWLREHPYFGAAVRDWQDQGGISLAGKRLATIGIVAVLLLSLALDLGPEILLVQMSVLGVVLWFIWTRPVPSDREDDTAYRADRENRN